MRFRINLVFFIGLLGSALLLSSACGASRTAAATQPTPAAFDPAASDAQALEIADAMLAAIGGTEAWGQVKQIRWEVKYYQNGDFKAWFKHVWDRWNGRHRLEMVDTDSYLKAEEAGKPDDAQWVIAMYDLFDREGKGYATFGGRNVMAEDRNRIVSDAYDQWKSDSYQLAMLYKLRDPGVQLSYVGEVQELKGKCQPGCVVIKVSFSPEVGSDTYFINVNKTTNMPEVLEKQLDGGTLGYAFEGWIELAGMRFPEKLVNLGVDEVIEISNVEIAEPDSSLFVPAGRRQ